jgi:hypothetical protein
MKHDTLATYSLALAIASHSAACTVDHNLTIDEEDTEMLEEGVTSANSLTLNSLTLNSLTLNSLTANTLMLNSLTASSLLDNALTATALESEASSRTLMYYIVGCALDPDQQISLTFSSGTSVTYNGSIGLASEWGEPGGQCDEECRGWVSACVLARLNFLGVRVPISIRGNHEALQVTPEEANLFPRREAAYFGNIFGSHQVRKACHSPGSEVIGRVCGSSNNNCGVDVLGSCAGLCNAPAADGSYSQCAYSSLEVALSPARRSQQTLTVFLQE